MFALFKYPNVKLWVFGVYFVLVGTTTFYGQTPTFNPNEFLEEAKPKLCGLFTQQESFVANMPKYTWKHEWVVQKLDKNKKLLSEHMLGSDVCIVTDQGIKVPTELNGKKFNQDLQSYFGTYLRIHPPSDFSCGDFGIREDVLSICSFTYSKLEEFEGVPVHVYSFHCGDKKPKKKFAAPKALGTEGMLWFEEESHLLIKAEGKYYKAGCRNCDLVAEQIRKNTTWRWQMKRFNNDWVFDYWERVYPTRTSFLTGYRRQYLKQIHRWYDYKLSQ
mgnify:CR=1 FL=1